MVISHDMKKLYLIIVSYYQCIYLGHKTKQNKKKSLNSLSEKFNRKHQRKYRKMCVDFVIIISVHQRVKRTDFSQANCRKQSRIVFCCVHAICIKQSMNRLWAVSGTETESIYHLDWLKHHSLFHNIDPCTSKDV